jgi:type IX secretion system PorP/SprF family membrane protein
MKKIVITILFVYPLICSAQNVPAFRQFYFNPFLFNPAYAGIEGYSEVMVYHRQQWINFNNAPVASGFNLQFPSSNRMAYGFNFIHQEVVALQSSTATFTFAYRIPFSSTHYLSFGLSGGLGSNTLNISDKDYSNDPAVLNASSNTFYADGNAGLVYTLGKLQLGFALPRLFGQPAINPQQLGNRTYSQWQNQLYSVSYQFALGSGGFSFRPYGLYRVNRDLQNYWEAAVLLYYQNKIWIGASYNETQGTGFFLGMDIREKVRFGYSYELPPVSPDFIAASSHEIHLQIRLGKKKIFKWAATEQKKPATTSKPVAEQPAVTKPADDAVSVTASPDRKSAQPADTNTAGELTPRKESGQLLPVVIDDKPVAAAKPVVAQPVTEKIETKQPTLPEQPAVTRQQTVSVPPSRQGVLAKGYYVIVGSYDSYETSQRGRQRFINLGFDQAYAGQHPVNKRYYVYIFASSDVEIARETRDYYRAYPVTRDAWVLSIE